jgi:hypothetical protein
VLIWVPVGDLITPMRVRRAVSSSVLSMGVFPYLYIQVVKDTPNLIIWQVKFAH